MLESKDTEAVKRWLRTALSPDAPNAITPSALARHCSVSPQAVNGWLRTGRITKSNLELAAEFLGSAPSFNGGPILAREASGPPWPFSKITPSRYRSLPQTELNKVEAFALFTLLQWEASAGIQP